MPQQGKPDWCIDEMGQERWWDGRGWTAHTQPRSDQTQTLPSPAGVKEPRLTRNTKFSKRPRRGIGAFWPGRKAAEPVEHRRRDVPPRGVLAIAAGAGVLGLCLGVGLGAGGSSHADPTTSTAFVSLQSKLTSATQERDVLKRTSAKVTARAQQVDDDRAALDQQKTELDDRSSALDARAAKLDAKAKKLAKQVASVKAAKAEAKAQSDDASSGGSSSSSGGSVYYANCSAAKAAGAAPVYRGDPGYASHLDRDGDGVGCE